MLSSCYTYGNEDIMLVHVSYVFVGRYPYPASTIDGSTFVPCVPSRPKISALVNETMDQLVFNTHDTRLAYRR
jgi:hypothetical protein